MQTLTRTPTRRSRWIEGLRSLLRSVGALSLYVAAALSFSGCGRSDTPASIIFSWVLVKASNPDPANAPAERCQDVGVEKIRLEIGSKNLFDYSCGQNAAQSQTVNSDTYHIRVSALGSAGNLIQSKEFPNTYVFGNTKLGIVRLSVP